MSEEIRKVTPVNETPVIGAAGGAPVVTSAAIPEQDIPQSGTDVSLIKTETALQDTKFRYLGYGARIKTALVRGARYLAYTSDLGEAFRPITHNLVVRAAYGISWAYVIADVGVETYREKERGSDAETIARTGTKRAIFQTFASMLLPMFTIHQTVHLTGNLLKRYGKTNRWIPTIAGLGVIPLLPFLFDHPVEFALDYGYDRFWPSRVASAGHSSHKEDRAEVAQAISEAEIVAQHLPPSAVVKVSESGDVTVKTLSNSSKITPVEK
eukprot:TRINITY_DN1811_c0_g1_i1.p1 TRINITY_DN1811_c0_g1~~TRINITY_DN1811_c0_g1_i1.p1  ORF type:complete len:268 (+),score=63.62 TRINITY_DN1811_c0_g1_i1:157-960(+)